MKNNNQLDLTKNNSNGMSLEKQVCSLEPAQKLKELGVKQESLFYYAHQGKIYSREHYYSNYNSNDENDQEAVTFEYYLSEVNSGQIYSAFTVAELGNLITSVKGIRLDSTRHTTMDEWSIAISETERIYADTEADARAKCLIYLIENNLISL